MSRSRDLESDTFYLSLYTSYSDESQRNISKCRNFDFPELKNLRNKKKFIAVACIQAEIESVTFKVT